MKPFDLEAAKRGEPIVTRDGRKAKFVAYVPEASPNFSVIALLDGNEGCTTYSQQGICSLNFDGCNLFMAPPPMRSINGYEYPEPVLEPLEIGQRYFVPYPYHESLNSTGTWDGLYLDRDWLKRGLLHLTREAAKAHARAIILASGGEV